MSFIAPLFLLLGLLAVPIILLYMLRLRRREVTVSSTLLWRALVRDREANAPWQKLRRNLLLLLQLLILAALVLALARPFLPTDSLITGNTIVLLDASASMQATDVAPSRFAAAQEAVQRLIADLGGGDQMTIIKVGRTPTLLAAGSTDQTALRDAVAAAPEAATADWESAVALAAGAAQGFSDARVVVVSDGGLPADLPPLPAEVVYVPVGRSGENLAITALATRDTADGPQLFAGVHNHGTETRSPLLSISLDGELFDARRLTVAPGATASATWNLPPETAVTPFVVGAQLRDNPADPLALDDQAWTVHAGATRRRGLLVTEGNLFLEQAMSVLPGVAAFKAAPGSPALSEPFDFYVFDGVALPQEPPPAPLLVINPPAGEENELFRVTGTITETTAVRLAESPLLDFVAWRDVNVREAQNVAAPWAQTVVAGEGGPLLLAGEQNGRRVVILPFDLRASDLPLQIAFPILMANITGWLSPGSAFDAPASVAPGEPVRLTPGTDATAVTVQKPDGTTWRADVGAAPLLFAETAQPGVYDVTAATAAGSEVVGRFAVNLFAPAEAAVAPAETIRLGQRTVTTAVAEERVAQQELWPWLVALAFLILLIEWWVHHRGTRLPRVKPL